MEQADPRRLADALEQALLAYEDAPCALLRTDSNGLILRANRTFVRWVGRSADELVGRLRLQDLFTMGGRIFHQTHWVPLLQMQGSVSEVKLDLVHADGRAVPVVMNAIRRDAEGGAVHDVALYVARDRDRYERELVQSRRRLQEAVEQARALQAQAKDRAVIAEQMIGIVSHDLRNPLSTIQTGLLLLSRLEPTPHQRRVHERIERAAARANRLIGDLLDFTAARLGGGIAVAPREIDLQALVHESVEELALAFPGRELRHVQLGKGDAAADPDRVVQMLGNLVGNAMAYGDAQRPVTVHCEIGEATVWLAVHNHGEPIARELVDRLFEPLTRGEAEAGANRSVGLGLYIVGEIARAHGGQVRVRSTVQDGTTFTVSLPRRARPARPEPSAAGV